MCRAYDVKAMDIMDEATKNILVANFTNEDLVALEYENLEYIPVVENEGSFFLRPREHAIGWKRTSKDCRAGRYGCGLKWHGSADG